MIYRRIVSGWVQKRYQIYVASFWTENQYVGNYLDWNLPGLKNEKGRKRSTQNYCTEFFML